MLFMCLKGFMCSFCDYIKRHHAKEMMSDMKESYSIFQVSNWFLQKSPMTHKKLQKMCYYAVAWYYALKDKPLVANCVFQAWIHGPVSPELYSRYAGFGLKDLTEMNCVEGYADIDDAEDCDFLESVYLTYGDLSSNAIEALTHTEAPWRNARGSLMPNERCANSISVDDMKWFYRSIYIGTEDDEMNA